MKIINKSFSIDELELLAKNLFGDMIKVVVDIEKEIMVVDAELHADEEAFLLEKGSSQKNLWRINLYPEFFGKKDFVEFNSMINVRPSQNNMSRGVEDEKIRSKIMEIVKKFIK